MTLGNKIDQAIERAREEAAATKEEIGRIREQVGAEVDERTKSLITQAEQHAEDARQRVDEIRDQVETVVRSPETAQELRQHAEVVVRWVNDHVNRLGSAGVNVDLPQDVQDAIDRLLHREEPEGPEIHPQP